MCGVGGPPPANHSPQALGANSRDWLGGGTPVGILAEDTEVNLVFVLKSWLSFDYICLE